MISDRLCAAQLVLALALSDTLELGLALSDTLQLVLAFVNLVAGELRIRHGALSLTETVHSKLTKVVTTLVTNVRVG